LPRHYRDGRCRQNFLTKLLREMIPDVLSMTPQKRDSPEWVGEISPRPKKLKFQRSRIKTMLIISFLLSRRNSQRIRTRWKNRKCIIL
jgi:hypothetical protein